MRNPEGLPGLPPCVFPFSSPVTENLKTESREQHFQQPVFYLCFLSSNKEDGCADNAVRKKKKKTTFPNSNPRNASASPVLRDFPQTCAWAWPGPGAGFPRLPPRDLAPAAASPGEGQTPVHQTLPPFTCSLSSAPEAAVTEAETEQ